MPCEGIEAANPLCHANEAAKRALGDAIQNLADAVLEMVGRAVSAAGTIWVYIGTPNLTDTGGPTLVRPGDTAPATSESLTTVLSYLFWIGLVVAAIAMVLLGIRIAASLRRGEGFAQVGRLGVILGAVVMISGASSLVSMLVPAQPTGAGGATLFIQSVLWWPMSLVAVVSVILAGIKMAVENRAQAGVDLVRGLLTLIVVAGASVTFVQLLITAADSFSIWVLNSSLDCDVSTAAPCFGTNVANMIAMSATNPTTIALGPMIVIIVGFIVGLASFAQVMLMIARTAALVLLSGIIIVPAAATGTEWGQSWFKRCVGWLVAFLLYKPAAAIIYAAAFQLSGTNVFRNDDGLVSVLAGVMLMILALVALPALMRFMTPLVGAVAGGAAGGMGATVVAALPSGAIQAGQLLAGGGKAGPSGAAPATGSTNTSSSTSTTTTSTTNASSPSGAQTGGPGPAGTGGASGSDGGTGRATKGNSGSDGASGAQGGTGATGQSTAGAAGTSGPSAGGSAAGAPAAAPAGGAGAAGTAGTAGTAGAAAGAGAAGAGAAAGAAGGPVGMAAGAAAGQIGGTAKAAGDAARGAASDVTGEES